MSACRYWCPVLILVVRAECLVTRMRAKTYVHSLLRGLILACCWRRAASIMPPQLLLCSGCCCTNLHLMQYGGDAVAEIIVVLLLHLGFLKNVTVFTCLTRILRATKTKCHC